MSLHNIGHTEMERINRMDTSAFRLLYSIFYKVLVSCAYRYTRNIGAAEDIVQEVFANLWECKRRFMTPVSLKAFFYSAVHNKSLNWLKHRNVVSRYAMAAAGGDVTAEQHEPVFKEEVYRQLFEAIDSMPERQREVFLLSMDGKSNAEIAAALDITVGTVKIHKNRGITYLRKHVSPQCMLLFMYFSTVYNPDNMTDFLSR